MTVTSSPIKRWRRASGRTRVYLLGLALFVAAEVGGRSGVLPRPVALAVFAGRVPHRRHHHPSRRSGEVMTSTVIDLTWMDGARCTQVGGDSWFPEKGASTRQVKRVCRKCPVKAECLQYALDNDERHGVWGGMSPAERDALKPEQAAA